MTKNEINRAYCRRWRAYAQEHQFCLWCYGKRVRPVVGKKMCARHLEADAFNHRLRRRGL